MFTIRGQSTSESSITGGKLVKLNHIPTTDMRADMMTENLTDRQPVKTVISKLRGDRIICIFIEYECCYII